MPPSHTISLICTCIIWLFFSSIFQHINMELRVFTAPSLLAGHHEMHPECKIWFQQSPKVFLCLRCSDTTGLVMWKAVWPGKISPVSVCLSANRII